MRSDPSSARARAMASGAAMPSNVDQYAPERARARKARPRYGSSGGAWSVEAARVPASVDVFAIRKAIPGGLTQEAFAKAFGFTFAAVRDWEQGRRKPDRSSRALLAVIASNPDAVRDALS